MPPVEHAAAGNITGIAITNAGRYTSTAGLTATIPGYNGVLTIGVPVANAAGGLTVTGGGTLTLGAANTYGGVTTVNGGALELGIANALPSASNLTLNGGVLGLGTGNATFSRALGAGSGQVQFTGSGGFAGYVSGANVNFGGSSAGVQWGSGSFVPSGSSLILGASTALDGSADTFTVTLANPINFAGVTQNIQVLRGAAATTDAALSGALTNGGLTVTGGGILSLAGANTYAGGTTVTASTLIGAETSGTPLGSGNIALNGGTLSLAPSSGAAGHAQRPNAAAGSQFTYGGGDALSLSKGSASTSTAFTVGNSSATTPILARNGNGTLIVASLDSATNLSGLGSGLADQYLVNSTASAAIPTLSNTLVNTSIVGQSTTNKAGDFLTTYTSGSTTGFKVATYSLTSFTGSTNASVVSISTATVSSATAAFALKDTGAITNTSTLTLGNYAATASSTQSAPGGTDPQRRLDRRRNARFRRRRRNHLHQQFRRNHLQHHDWQRRHHHLRPWHTDHFRQQQHGRLQRRHEHQRRHARAGRRRHASEQLGGRVGQPQLGIQ